MLWLVTYRIGRVRRLVRKSPFDRVTAVIPHSRCVCLQKSMTTLKLISIHLTRTDTYRAWVQVVSTLTKPDSAVRLTHAPTGIVVACQNQRSQHANRDHAWKQLRAKL